MDKIASVNPNTDRLKPPAGSSRNRWIFIVAFILLLLGLVWYQTGQHRASNNPMKEGKVDPSKRSVPVTLGTVGMQTVPIALTAIGNTETLSSVNVKSQVDGQVVRVHFKEGQFVRAGELLFTIDPRPYQAVLSQARAMVSKDIAQVRQAQSNLAKDQAQVKQAEANLQKDQAQLTFAQAQERRYLSLSKQEFISKEQYEQASTNRQASEAGIQADRAVIQNLQAQTRADMSAIQSAQATVRADQAAAENNQIKLNYSYIRAPFSGKTGSYLVHEGDSVKTNDTNMVMINQVAPIHVAFSVPEQQLATIKRYQQNGHLRVQATPSDKADGNPLIGILDFMDNTVDPNTGTIRLKGLFPNTSLQLWPGQYVNVTLTLGEHANAVVVPQQAVQTGQKGDYVFVANNGKAALRPVVVGQRINGLAVIDSGLTPGQQVVVDGQSSLAPGMRLKVKRAI